MKYILDQSLLAKLRIMYIHDDGTNRTVNGGELFALLLLLMFFFPSLVGMK